MDMRKPWGIHHVSSCRGMGSQISDRKGHHCMVHPSCHLYLHNNQESVASFDHKKAPSWRPVHCTHHPSTLMEGWGPLAGPKEQKHLSTGDNDSSPDTSWGSFATSHILTTEISVTYTPSLGDENHPEWECMCPFPTQQSPGWKTQWKCLPSTWHAASSSTQVLTQEHSTEEPSI